MAKKIRRIVLGVGHPWFLSRKSNKEIDSVTLFKRTTDWEAQTINIGKLGNWNKIRLVAEVIK